MDQQRISRLDLSCPVRRIGTSRRALRGNLCVRNRTIRYESGLERDFMLILDYDRSVTDVFGQPVKIKFVDSEGKNRTYTPDFLVFFDSNVRPKVLYEVKYLDDLREEWADLKPKYLAARRYARENNLRFSIITDVEIRRPYLANCVFLKGYVDRRPSPKIDEHLVNTLASIGATTVQTLLVASYLSEEQRIEAIGPLWRLIAITRIEIDLHTRLSMASEIWVNIGEGFL